MNTATAQPGGGGPHESRVQELGRQLLARARGERGIWTRFSDRALLGPLMRSDELRVAALRFVDVLPALQRSGDLTDHLQEYFASVTVPGIPSVLQRGLLGLAGTKAASPFIAAGVRAMAGRMARKFIAGDRIDAISRALLDLHRRGMGFTLDLLGEAVVSEAEAQAYHSQYLELLRRLEPIVAGWAASTRMDHISGRTAPRHNLSLKVSALYSQIAAVAADRSVGSIRARLHPILHEARARGAFITLDMEHYDTKDITLRAFREILMEPEFRDWPDAGIAIQAYLRDTPGDLSELIQWAQTRETPVMVRLVRGAYWDFETVHAQQHGWRIPVWTRKQETDACYEHCLSMLMRAYPHIETAVATHNVRSLAVAMALAEDIGLGPGQYETQMLFGMADELKSALVAQGIRLRVYVPFGQLIPGMAYLVRRLLENTASQSFLRMGFSEHLAATELLAPPPAGAMDVPVITPRLPSGGFDAMDIPPFVNEPVRRFTDAQERREFADALERVRAKLGAEYALIIGGDERSTAQKMQSNNPSRPSQIVGITGSASRQDASLAVEAACGALAGWRETPVEQRAQVLFRAAQLMRSERDELSAWEVLEGGKPWREADADVCEAIDFLEYYGREAVRLWRGHRFDVPGETNRYFYEPRGVVVVIAPWNFPLAILCGMTAAALVTGNTVAMKPAPQTPILAAHLTRILHRAGLPPGVLNYLPGGDEAGDALVRDPRIKMIAFTGSVPVGKIITNAAAQVPDGQHHLKHVVAELGGKNALIIDSDADLDEAVFGTVASAFGYAGQKCSACSRAIVIGDLYEPFLSRLKEAAASLAVGDPADPATYMGPVIDREAFDRIQETIEAAAGYCRTILRSPAGAANEGYYIAPTIYADVPPDSDLAQNEVFGPVLAVMQARDLDHALELANGTRYALTGGVYSRSPAHLEAARQRFRVGNLYLNRKITGAIVGRQPFGGMKLSGTDAKAGGPDYLLHFVEPRHITENTLRRGFAPEIPPTPAEEGI